LLLQALVCSSSLPRKRGINPDSTYLCIALGLFLAVKVFKAKLFSDLDNMAWVIAAALGTSTAIDFFIAGAMCWNLYKSRGVGSRLNSRIDLVMQYTLGSGLLTR
jgi:hypothetical protein